MGKPTETPVLIGHLMGEIYQNCRAEKGNLDFRDAEVVNKPMRNEKQYSLIKSLAKCIQLK